MFKSYNNQGSCGSLQVPKNSIKHSKDILTSRTIKPGHFQNKSDLYDAYKKETSQFPLILTNTLIFFMFKTLLTFINLFLTQLFKIGIKPIKLKCVLFVLIM